MSKKIIYLALLLSPLGAIQTPGIPLSLFKITIILVFLFCAKYLIPNKKGQYLTFSILFAFSSITAYLVSVSPSANTFLLQAIMACGLFVILPNCFRRKDTDTLIKLIIRSQYIVIPFSILGLYLFYVNGGLPDILTLPGGFYYNFDEAANDRIGMGFHARLMLPYLSPPFLSVIMAFVIVVLYLYKSIFNNIIRITLIVVFSLVLILTSSRSGIFGLAAVVLLRIFESKLSKKSVFAILGVVIVIYGVIYVSSQLEYMETFMKRMTGGGGADLEEDRHLLIPLDGILLWLDSVPNFLFGIGLNSSMYMKGAHTELPPTFLNSFVTWIAERGIWGLFLDIILLRMTLQLYRFRKKLTESENAFLYAFIALLASTLFYETFDGYITIFIISIFFTIHTAVFNQKKLKVV